MPMTQGGNLLKHFGPAELPAQHHLAVFRHPVELKNLLR